MAHYMRLLHFSRPDGSIDSVIARQAAWGSPEQRRETIERELQTLELARDLALPAPRSRGIDRDGEFTLWLEHVPGLPDFAPCDLDSMTAEMARVLLQIHAVPGLDPRLAFLPRIADELEAWLTAPRLPFDESLGEPRIRDVLREAGGVPRSAAEVLLHGDYWPSNLLFRDGRLEYVVDWEETAVGDARYDVGLARLDLLFAFGEEAMQRFTDYYWRAQERDDRTEARWELFVALRPCGNLARWAAAYTKEPINRPDITEHTLRAAHQAFVKQAIERL